MRWQQYQHPGADGEQLREFGGDDDDGLASVGQFLGPLDDSALVPMSTPAIGSSRISTSGSRGSAEQDPFRPPGGMGSVIGSLFGSLLIGLINNGLILVALARKK